MHHLTTIERRALKRISTPGGGVMIVAADQRNSMRAVMGADEVTREQLRDAKGDLARLLAAHGPAILLDAEVALPWVIHEDVLPRDTALVVGMDASGYELVAGLRHTRYVPAVTPGRVRRLGGDAAKMLFHLRPDLQDLDSRVAGEIRGLVELCDAEGLLLIVEILTYRLDSESPEEYEAVFPSLISRSAEFAVACGARMLKLPYPGSAAACAEVTSAAAGVPWAVLSAGVDHGTFVGQVDTAVRHGAAGAMAGRSLWKDSLSVDPDVRAELLTKRAVPRLAELQRTIDGALAAR